MAADRPVPRRSCGRGQRRAGGSGYLVLRRRRRRRMEEYRCRRFLEAHVRRSKDRVDRRDCGRRLGSQCHLCRHRGSMSARQYHVRRRCLQIRRRGSHLEEHGAQGHPANRRSDRASQEPGHRTGRRSRACVWPERRTRRVPQRRRRADLDQGSIQGPGHRRDRRGIRSRQSQHRLRLAVANAPPALELLERRAWLRPLQIDGRRPHVEASRGHGLPAGILGRIGVSVAGAGGGRGYSMIEAPEGGLFRSDDAGDSWTRVNDDHRFRQRAWYYSHVFADPASPDVVYVLNTGAFRSADGGKTFELMPAPHGDHHALWIDPKNPRRLINGSDGGASISVDGGKSWTQPYNQPTAQFYHVAVDNRWPYRVYGAQQDNSTIAISSRDDEGVIGRQDWFQVGGGESGFIAPDPKNPEIIYANSDSGQMTRLDHRTNNLRDVSVYPLDVSGNGAANLQFRLQWTEPLFVSVHDSNVLYTAAQFVLRSPDQGRTWKAISPDLTRNDKSKQQPSGGPITLDITSVEYYDTVFALSESRLQPGLLWAGSDDGLIHVTRNDGQAWSDVTPKDLPAWSMVSLIDPSPHDAATAYVAVDRHKLDDLKPLIYRTHDFGKTWTRIVAGIPDGAYVRAVREDPAAKGLLYAGTELGVFFSADDGAHWQALQLNLPTTPVHDLVVKDNDLVAATHGRSFWILDDLSPLRQAAEGLAPADFHLFKPASAVRLHYPPQVERRLPVGDNPPAGAVIDYFLKNKPSDTETITLEILTAEDKLVRRISNHKRADGGEQPEEWTDREKPLDVIPGAAGANRFAWDLRGEDPEKIPGAFYSDEGPRGPIVAPGPYKGRLTGGGRSQTAPLEVVPDPRLKGQIADREANELADLSKRTWTDIDALHKAVNQIRGTRARLDTIKKWRSEE